MDNQNDYMVTSRDEYIRLARESCLKNLGNNSGDMEIKKMNKVNVDVSPFSYNKNDFGQGSFLMSTDKIDFNQVWMKRLLIRTICATVLFLTIFLIDKLNFTYKELNSQSIETIVTTSKGFDATEEYFVNIFKSLVNEDEAVVKD